LAEIAPDVDDKGRVAAWRWIWMAPSLVSLDDLECVSRATLDERLLPPEESMITSLGRFKKGRRKKDV
jgi:hypothetical protein